jgi:hypothetical protein
LIELKSLKSAAIVKRGRISEANLMVLNGWKSVVETVDASEAEAEKQ